MPGFQLRSSKWIAALSSPETPFCLFARLPQGLVHVVTLSLVSAKPEGKTWRGEKLGLLGQQPSFFRSPSTIPMPGTIILLQFGEGPGL